MSTRHGFYAVNIKNEAANFYYLKCNKTPDYKVTDNGGLFFYNQVEFGFYYLSNSIFTIISSYSVLHFSVHTPNN